MATGFYRVLPSFTELLRLIWVRKRRRDRMGNDRRAGVWKGRIRQKFETKFEKEKKNQKEEKKKKEQRNRIFQKKMPQAN